MRTRLLSVAVASIGLLFLAAAPALAHHAFAAEFDAKKPVKLRGIVLKMEWINPHAWIHVAVKKPDGTIDEWMIEAGTPNTLLRRGLTKESLKAGTEILVDGYQSKDGSPGQTAATSRSLTGKRYFWVRPTPARLTRTSPNSKDGWKLGWRPVQFLTAICIRQSPTWNILLPLALSTAIRNDNAECKRMFQVGDRRMPIAAKNHTGRHTLGQS